MKKNKKKKPNSTIFTCHYYEEYFKYEDYRNKHEKYCYRYLYGKKCAR